MSSQPDDVLAEQLHNWYLEITANLSNKAFNKNAQKPYAELSNQQQAIDKYIAYKVEALIAEQVREAKLSVIDEVFSLSPSKSFNQWKPIDAVRFYGVLKAFEAELQKQGGDTL